MKKVSALVVTALIPLLAATMAESCAGGVESVSGSGGDNGSGGSDDGSGGSSSGGKTGSGGSSSSSGGRTSSGGSSSSSGGSSSSSGGKTSSGGSSSSSGGKTGSGGSSSSSGGSSSSSGGSSSSSGGSSSSSGGSSASSGGSSGGTASGGTTGSTCTQMDSTIASNGLATSGTWTGYAYTYMGSAPSSIMPTCGATGSCFSSALKKLCVSGSVGPDPTSAASAGFGWNIGGTTDPPKAIAPGGTGLAYNVVGLATWMRFQIEGATSAETYCANVPTATSGTVPWTMFHKTCYNNPPGAAYDGTTPIKSVGIVVPSDTGPAKPFCLCVVSLGPAM